MVRGYMVFVKSEDGVGRGNPTTAIHMMTMNPTTVIHMMTMTPAIVTMKMTNLPTDLLEEHAESPRPRLIFARGMA